MWENSTKWFSLNERRIFFLFGTTYGCVFDVSYLQNLIKNLGALGVVSFKYESCTWLQVHLPLEL